MDNPTPPPQMFSPSNNSFKMPDRDRKVLRWVLLILFWPFTLTWWIWHRANTPKWAKVAVTAFCALALLAGLRSTGSSSPAEPVASSAPVAAVTSTPAPTPTPVPLAYEVMSDNGAKSTKRVEVYTTETASDRLIAINDLLVGKYQPGSDRLYIDYFNDKSVIPGYFDKQLDDSVSEDEKNRLYSHYVAIMTDNSNTGFRQFTRQSDSSVLKKY